jgi:DHA1 family bicyclomycin/chloramphenicol resistance-like MFS transporter
LHHATPPKGLTLIIALTSMIGPFTIDTYLPSFPDIEAEFAISRALLTQSLAFYLVAFAVSTLVLGPLADRLGRRLVLLGTLVIYTIASLGCAMAADYPAFLGFRLLQGIAAGGGLVAGRAMIRDVHNPREAQKAMSRVMMLFGLAPAVAPVIGGWLHDAFGWRSVFYFLAVYSSTIFSLILIRVAETLPTARRQSFHPLNVARVYGRTLKHRRFQFLVFIVACYFGGMFLYIAAAPSVIFDFLHLNGNDFAVLFMPMVGGMITGAWLSGQLAHRQPAEQTIRMALLIMALGTILNSLQAQWLAPIVLTTVGPLVIYTIGIGMAMPAMTVLSLDCFPENRGSASAMQGFVQMLGNAVISSVAVPLLSVEPAWLALGQTTLILIAWVLWRYLPRAGEAPAPAEQG